MAAWLIWNRGINQKMRHHHQFKGTNSALQTKENPCKSRVDPVPSYLKKPVAKQLFVLYCLKAPSVSSRLIFLQDWTQE